MHELSCDIERGAHEQPEIKGYTREYPEAIESAAEAVRGTHGDGRRARRWGRADRGASASGEEREATASTRRTARARHQETVREYGQQPQRIVTEAAHSEGMELGPEQSGVAAQQGVSFARERGMEREAVADERTLMRVALMHTMGEARLPEIRAEFERRVQSHDLIEVERRPGLPGRLHS